MALELVQALITIVKHCFDCGNCSKCSMKEFCGKIPTEW